MGFSRQEYWSGLSFPSPGDLPDPGVELVSLTFPALQASFFVVFFFLTASATWEGHRVVHHIKQPQISGKKPTGPEEKRPGSLSVPACRAGAEHRVKLSAPWPPATQKDSSARPRGPEG